MQNIKVDGVQLNGDHFLAMDKKDAVKAMKADGILEAHGKNDKWAEDAYETLKKASKEQTDAIKKALVKEAEQSEQVQENQPGPQA